jgi:hypothetical protein
MPKSVYKHRQNSALTSELGLDSLNNFSLMDSLNNDSLMDSLNNFSLMSRSGNNLGEQSKADGKTHTSLNKVPSQSF